MIAEVGYTDLKNCTGKICGYPLITENVRKYEDKVCAKLFKQSWSGDANYYIKYYNGNLYNPNAQTKPRHASYEWKKVNKEVFRLYLEFLRTGLERFLVNAERKLM